MKNALLLSLVSVFLLFSCNKTTKKETFDVSKHAKGTCTVPIGSCNTYVGITVKNTVVSITPNSSFSVANCYGGGNVAPVTVRLYWNGCLYDVTSSVLYCNDSTSFNIPGFSCIGGDVPYNVDLSYYVNSTWASVTIPNPAFFYETVIYYTGGSSNYYIQWVPSGSHVTIQLAYHS